MNIADKLKRYISDADYRWDVNSGHGLYDWIPDQIYLKLLYKRKTRKKLDLNNPQSFNEKMQWLKLHDRNPLYTVMVDKYAVKEYVSNVIGEKYIIPTLGVWEHFDDINFDSLPERFVLKCTHDSGGVVICRNKDTWNPEEAKQKLEQSLRKNYYYAGREWPYKNVKPRIIAEEMIAPTSSEELYDYKLYVFNGKTELIMINTGREKGRTTADYFDAEYHHLDFQWGYPNSEEQPHVPENISEMRELAEQLAGNVPAVRVDLYDADGKIYFGEYTFYDGSGLSAFQPEYWDKTIGEFITLPDKTRRIPESRQKLFL